MSKPELPNPGKERYWQVAQDKFENFILTLRDRNGAKISEDTIWADDMSASVLNSAAVSLLTRVRNKETFVGSYTFEEKN